MHASNLGPLFITQHALCSQVRCKQSLSSKIFQSSQAVMKDQSNSLSASWKVGLEQQQVR